MTSSAPCISRFKGFNMAITNKPMMVQNTAIPVKILNSPKDTDHSPSRVAQHFVFE